MAVKIYKRGQGKYTRSVTFAAGALIGALIGHYVWKQMNAGDLSNYNAAGLPVGLYLIYGVPLLIFIGVTGIMYLAVNRPRTADFMIATEGEMKKVSWSSRREIVGGTKVVIATTFILATLLWAVDVGWGFFMKEIGVLKMVAGE